MHRIFIFLFAFSFMISCKSHEVRNKFLESKHHPSDELSKEHAKATKKAKHDLVSNQKKNKSDIDKKNGHFFKLKKHYSK